MNYGKNGAFGGQRAKISSIRDDWRPKNRQTVVDKEETLVAFFEGNRGSNSLSKGRIKGKLNFKLTLSSEMIIVKPPNSKEGK